MRPVSRSSGILRLPVRVACMPYVLIALVVLWPAAAAAQERPLVIDVTGGYAGFVDDATKHHFVAGGAVRKYVTPRLSLGPEFVVMPGEGDLAVMLTGNVVYDLAPANGPDAERRRPSLWGGWAGSGSGTICPEGRSGPAIRPLRRGRVYARG